MRSATRLGNFCHFLCRPYRQDHCPILPGAAASVLLPAIPPPLEHLLASRTPASSSRRAEAYADVFREAGFSVPFVRIEPTTTRCAREQLLKVFNSGAATGVAEPEC
ncbi:MAG TPA: hypothetical protein VMK12_06245 [Anaeromyxobacteraceae bacterium]|nr:hypothetical protein [Anaeromyxobacteraceae bacterium]